MSNIINDIATGVNVVRGLMEFLQKSSVILHNTLQPVFNINAVNQALQSADAYCNSMQEKHLTPKPDDAIADPNTKKE